PRVSRTHGMETGAGFREPDDWRCCPFPRQWRFVHLVQPVVDAREPRLPVEHREGTVLGDTCGTVDADRLVDHAVQHTRPTGSMTGYGLSWLVVLVYPMLATIQIIGAQVGVVAKRGLQQAVRQTYGRGWGLCLLASVLAVNAVTIGADLEAGAAAFGLVLGVD